MHHCHQTLLTACAGLCMALLAGCAGTPARPPAADTPSVGPGPRGGTCNAAPAQGAKGKQPTASTVEQARVASGAAMARVLRDNQPVTMEFNAERLNLVTDASGKITTVRCG
ncbi:I78 family peptidase inhibitor [Acidovorax sp. Root217]|uniref:I78 family peptidase inhibitor n=1 Tax=Acidovorax sp. Root217 TaxID=1736492 RepID=UPI00070E9A7E|nr:I78 family peptidase inhibitor [Acidovorax sp. Root217]KRC15307.1 hypothetical protein ASE31_30635 [Acidovorax sp. Root217]